MKIQLGVSGVTPVDVVAVARGSAESSSLRALVDSPGSDEGKYEVRATLPKSKAQTNGLGFRFCSGEKMTLELPRRWESYVLPFEEQS
jgi:hypothetical protein